MMEGREAEPLERLGPAAGSHDESRLEWAR
jgi:hypothetical protein